MLLELIRNFLWNSYLSCYSSNYSSYSLLFVFGLYILILFEFEFKIFLTNLIFFIYSDWFLKFKIFILKKFHSFFINTKIHFIILNFFNFLK